MRKKQTASGTGRVQKTETIEIQVSSSLLKEARDIGANTNVFRQMAEAAIKQSIDAKRKSLERESLRKKQHRSTRVRIMNLLRKTKSATQHDIDRHIFGYPSFSRLPNFMSRMTYDRRGFTLKRAIMSLLKERKIVKVNKGKGRPLAYRLPNALERLAECAE